MRKQEEDALRNNDSLPSVCFPTASAIACSWDIEAAAKLAKALGTEAVKEQIAVVLGPGINIKRSPLCGRNFEYFSEDPYLAGTLATAYINALQSTGVAASLKHFAGNSQETHRQTSNSQIDERALREIYLSAFEMAVKEARPATIMASYNRLNGSYACENKMLLTDILRKEWGFEGVVVSDWGACADLPKCIEAGMDLEMPDSCNYHSPMLEEALQSGKLSEVSIDRAAGNMLHLTDRYSGSSGTLKVSDHTDLHQLAKELACESAVLLKNDGVLPLREESIILVIGDLAKTMRFQGGGSSHINTVKTPNALEALRANGVKLQFYRGYRADSDRVDQKLEKEAIDAVKAAEGETPVLFFGGLTEYTEGEGYDRKTLDLPKNQVSLVEKLHVLGAKLAFVSFGGSPFSIPFISHVHAILHMYLGGEAAGEACTQLLLGNVNPSGKLAETFPMKTEDIPCNPWFGTGSDDVEYRESIFVGYRYYDTYQRPVLFPFGHGLSYTTFRYSNLEADCDTFCGG
ncbi:MAG TPA: glycoside hydrolase family 3 N-terminal domain-containing protein, partial [Lachnospiraceae bacterium]|nr:glycoside hydrolase family 3 N-terminal domain-containing protein [Lachnospiraceae bacterium]